MRKELPNVFVNKIDKIINNVQDMYYGNGINRVDVNTFLDKLYNSGKYVFKTSLDIVVNGEHFIERIAARTKDYIITLSNKKIKINDIESINEVK